MVLVEKMVVVVPEDMEQEKVVVAMQVWLVHYLFDSDEEDKEDYAAMVLVLHLSQPHTLPVVLLVVAV